MLLRLLHRSEQLEIKKKKKKTTMESELGLSLGIGEPQKQMTIFYKGRVCVCSATEIQAKAILSMAKREMEEEKKVMVKQEIAPQLPQVMLNPGLSMKRSLQRFLQKRKIRIHDASAAPYVAHANLKGGCSA